MKTKLITALFFLLTFQLNAQFHFKVSMDETGLYSVKLKSDVVVNPGAIIGSGQIALHVPFGGFKIGEITSVNGIWNNNYDIIGKEFEPALTHEYYFIGLKDGTGIADNGIVIGEEITLITFRNIGECTGPVEVVTATAQIFLYKGSCTNCLTANYPGNDLSTFDTLAKIIYKFSGAYETGQAICNPYVNYSPIKEIIELEVDEKGLNQYNFRWSPVENTSFYELKIRQKGKLNWEKKLIATMPTAYFYAPIEREYEYQVIAHDKTKVTQSKIAKFSNLIAK